MRFWNHFASELNYQICAARKYTKIDTVEI